MAHPKGVLIERLHKLGLGKPDFQTKSTGPQHEQTFLSDVLVGGQVYGTGQGSTKRDAERQAAEEALAYLDQHHAPTLPEEESAPAAPARGRDARGPRIATVPRTSEEAAKEAERATRRDARPARRDTAPRSAPSRPGKRDRGAEPAPATDQFEDLPTPERAEPTHEPFTGPWPVFEELLATTMEIAEERVDPDLTGDAALAAIRDFTLGLYKQVLESLGEVVEVEE